MLLFVSLKRAADDTQMHQPWVDAITHAFLHHSPPYSAIGKTPATPQTRTCVNTLRRSGSTSIIFDQRFTLPQLLPEPVVRLPISTHGTSQESQRVQIKYSSP